MYEKAFKIIDTNLRTDEGCSSELDYTEQTSWMLFLRYLDVQEQEQKSLADLEGKPYTPLLETKYQWTHWAYPLDTAGKLDTEKALKGTDLIDFINTELFVYLKSLKDEDNTGTLQYRIGEVFGELKNRCENGHSLRNILNEVHTLSFNKAEHRHELSMVYEDKIRNMGNAGRNGGEYYTPRPLIKAMIQVLSPQIGETIYDGACGSAGFLCEAYEHLLQQVKTTDDQAILQDHTLYGKEKKPLAYVIGIMNMILHGIKVPNIRKMNTLAMDSRSISESDKYNVILANPPFGGSEQSNIQNNFTYPTSETATLFMQHFFKSLKTNGRAGVVIKNTFLSNMDSASVAVREMLLKSAKLDAILDCPAGTFLGAGVKTVVLFFTKGQTTENIWYYALDPGRKMGKTNPLNDKDMAEFIKLYTTKPETEKSWNVAVDVLGDGVDLSVKNPNIAEEIPLASPTEILAQLEQYDMNAKQQIDILKGLLK